MVAVHVFYLIVYIIRKMDKKFEQIYHSDDGYWRGKSAIQKLAKASGLMKEEAEKWLLRQPLHQIYLPAPKYVPRPNASMSLFAKPNDIHQSDLLSLPHDKFKEKTYKYALNIVDERVNTRDPIDWPLRIARRLHRLSSGYMRIHQ